MGVFNWFKKKEESINCTGVIEWGHTQEHYHEGEFLSAFFCNGEGDHRLGVIVDNPSFYGYAERCVGAFNKLSKDTITDICKGIIKCAKKCGMKEGRDIPKMKDPTDIINYCWFETLSPEEKKDNKSVTFAIEGEGEWGECIGFVISNGKVVYVGDDCVGFLIKRL